MIALDPVNFSRVTYYYSLPRRPRFPLLVFKGTYTFTLTGTGGSPTKTHTATAKLVKSQKP
jgi:hypothetical protein